MRLDGKVLPESTRVPSAGYSRAPAEYSRAPGGIPEAINRIYHSELYKKLSPESTKYWHLGPVDLYEELRREQ